MALLGKICGISDISTNKIDTVSFANVSKLFGSISKAQYLYTWGDNDNGQLGLGCTGIPSTTATMMYSPVQIGSSTSWTSIASLVASSSLLANNNGSLYSTGTNTGGQLGLGDTTNKSSMMQVGSLSNWSTNISNLVTSTFAINNSGELYAWGTNTNGQLGNGTTTSRSSPVRIGTSTTWTKVSGGNSVLAIDNGALYVCGLNTTGQLGLGDITNRSSFTRVGSSSNWTFVCSGVNNSAGIDGGKLFIWGRNEFGQLCNNIASMIQLSPQQIGSLTTWTNIDTGLYFFAGIESGKLYTCGYNFYGQLGLANSISFDSIPRSSPVQVGTSTTWTYISCGSNTTKGIDSGKLYTWGNNDYGQLGIGIGGSGTERHSPNQVGSSTTWTLVGGREVHTLGINNGNLYTWGNNNYGQLGLGDITSRSSPVQVGSLNDWTHIAGTHHSLAIRNGYLYAWGNNDAGQLGLGDITSRSSPVQVGSLNGWTAIATGGTTTSTTASSNAFSLGINNGKLYAWGNNNDGQLGLGDTIARSSPVQVGSSTTWTKISCGNTGCKGINNGYQFAWGTNTYGELSTNDSSSYSSPVQIGSSNNWTNVSISPGNSSICISGGALYTIGFNYNGALGLGYNETTFSVSSPIQVGSDTNWSSVSIGGSYTGNNANILVYGIKTNGECYVWGHGNATGIENLFTVFSPTRIGTDTNWTKVSINNLPTAIALKGGKIYTLGSNLFHQLGYSNSTSEIARTFTQVGSYSNWTDISMGIRTCYGISNGKLYVWGNNSAGQAADIFTYKLQPTRVNSSTTWSSVACGGNHIVGIDNGYLYSWGRNALGQLGLGNTTSRSSPVQIGSNNGWTNIACGDNHTMCISGGALYTFGSNTNGQLGDGTIANKSSPVRVGNSSGWTDIMCGGNFSYGIDTNNIYSWGINTYGELGLGDINHRSSPTLFGSSTGWTKITCGFTDHVLGIKNGELYAWGYNTTGALGLGDIVHRSSPTKVGSLTTWTAIAAGSYHSCGINSGKLYCWGGNDYGQLGTENTTYYSSPVQVGSSTTWTAIFAGLTHTIGINNGIIYSWGRNNLGQLGLDNRVDRSSPVQMGSISHWISLFSGSSGEFSATIM